MQCSAWAQVHSSSLGPFYAMTIKTLADKSQLIARATSLFGLVGNELDKALAGKRLGAVVRRNSIGRENQ